MIKRCDYRVIVSKTSIIVQCWGFFKNKQQRPWQNILKNWQQILKYMNNFVDIFCLQYAKHILEDSLAWDSI